MLSSQQRKPDFYKNCSELSQLESKKLVLNRIMNTLRRRRTEAFLARRPHWTQNHKSEGIQFKTSLGKITIPSRDQLRDLIHSEVETLSSGSRHSSNNNIHPKEMNIDEDVDQFSTSCSNNDRVMHKPPVNPTQTNSINNSMDLNDFVPPSSDDIELMITQAHSRLDFESKKYAELVEFEKEQDSQAAAEMEKIDSSRQQCILLCPGCLHDVLVVDKRRKGLECFSCAFFIRSQLVGDCLSVRQTFLSLKSHLARAYSLHSTDQKQCKKLERLYFSVRPTRDRSAEGFFSVCWSCQYRLCLLSKNYSADFPCLHPKLPHLP